MNLLKKEKYLNLEDLGKNHDMIIPKGSYVPEGILKTSFLNVSLNKKLLGRLNE